MMQQFDTLTLAIPKKAIKGVNKAKFVYKPQTDCSSGATTELYQLKASECPTGISKLSWVPDADILLTYSAKVLKDDYLTGINKDNWYRGIEVISDIAEIDTDIVYNSALIHRADSTNNLLLSEIGADSKSIYTSLLASKGNIRFKDVVYNSKNKEGIEFRGMQQEKNRMIVYRKHLDLLKSANKEFLKSLNNATNVYELAQKQIRFEVNHTSFKSLRSRFNVETNSLKNLLNSSAPVNHNFLQKIINTKDIKQTNLFDEFLLFKDYKSFIEFKGLQTIIRELNYNDSTIKNFLQSIIGNNETFKSLWYGKRRKYSIKELVNNLQSENYKTIPMNSDSITNKILAELLKAVA